MTGSSETEIEPVVNGGGAPGVRQSREAACRLHAVELTWPPTPSGRQLAFERWEDAAIRCLRQGGSDFAALISLRKALRPDGLVTVTNSELAIAAGCSSKTLEIDLGRLKRSGLIISAVRSMRGFRGRIRVIRLSLPASDESGGRI